MTETLLAVRTRSGLIETLHYGAAAVATRHGEVIAGAGDIDRPFYLRSSAKPFQAFVSQQCGADLQPVEMALAAASHRGLPVHVAVVESILAKASLDPTDLRCPPSWPISDRAARRLAAVGAQGPARIWNNCSGKHAGFLRACAASGWPLDTYLDPGHPLQKRVIEVVSELSGYPAEPVGVDGCGAPVLRTTTRAMARLFSRLGNLPELGEVFAAMHQYPSLVSANGEGDASIAVATHAAAKGGAQGCIGVSIHDGHGIAVKSWDGSIEIATLGAIAAMEQAGDLWHEARRRLEHLARPDVLGGGTTVGRLEPRLELGSA